MWGNRGGAMKFYRMGLALLILVSLIRAGVTGKIAGQVTDRRTGEPLPGANIIISGTAMGNSSDSDGYFFILNVPPGDYNVVAQFIGYQPLTMTNVYVRVDHTTSLDFALEAHVLAGEAVVVEARRPEVERDVTSTVVSVSASELAVLPVNTVGDVLRLQAGVVSSGGLHFRGGRSGELAYLIDGHRVEDPLFGGNPTDINNEAIQQMELITGTFNAEYGNAMSGVVNIVTKENVGNYSGRIRYKQSRLGIDHANDLLNKRYLEGSITGPLIPGKRIGFLISGKLDLEDSYYEAGKLVLDTTLSPTPIPSGQYANRAAGYENLRSMFTKLYFSPFRGAKMAFSYNFNDAEWQNYIHSYKYIPDSTYIRFRKNHLVAMNFTHAPSTKLFYEMRLSYYQNWFLKNYGGHNLSDYGLGSSVYFPGADFRKTAGNEEYIEQKISTLTEKIDVSWQANRFHFIKTGIEFKQHDIEYFWLFGPRRAPANQYTNDFRKFPFEGAVYLQDKLEFETIVLNAGLRYDYYHSRVTYIADPNDRAGSVTDARIKTQLSPRLGIAYPVTEKTVFHFAYGHFFQRPTFEVLYEDLSRNMDVNKPLIGNPDLNPQSTVSYEFGLHTTLSRSASMQTTVFSKKIKDLIGVAWQFKLPGVPLQYAYYTNEDFAYVKGFEINLKWRVGHVSTRGNYTFSIAEGSSSSQQARFEGAYDVKGRQSLQFYPLDFDQRHMGNASISWSYRSGEGPFGFGAIVFQNSNLSLIAQYGGGLPFTYNPTRKRYEPNLNNARRPATLFIDLEAEKRFDLSGFSVGLFCQVYNLPNRKNVRSVYSATGKADDAGPFATGGPEYIADPTMYYAPRIIYLGVSLGF